MIRVLIADDYRLMRDAMRRLLEQQDDIRVVGEAADGLEAIHLVTRLTPDVLLLDISMPRLNGMEALRQEKDSTSPT